MEVDESVKAVLSCYCSSPDAIDGPKLQAVFGHAASASRALRLALHIRGPATDIGERLAALRSRAVVDGAVALIMRHDGSTRDEALTLLQRGSRTGHGTVLAVAADIIQGTFPCAT